MQTLSIPMPVVQDCSVSECVYNTGKLCHAKAITIGDGGNPACDTYLCIAPATPAPVPAGHQGAAGVGACKVGACRHNEDYECTAEAISVGHHTEHVHCLTYAAR